MTALDRTLEALKSAPYEAGGWDAALRGMATATKSRSSQLVGWLGPREMLVNLYYNMPETWEAEWLARRGSDPAVSPLVAKGIRAELMEDFGGHELLTSSEMARHPLWAEFFCKIDAPHVTCATMWRERGLHLALVNIRSNREGPLEGDNRRAYRRILRHWREAALLSRALKEDGARLLRGVMAEVGTAIFVLDGLGQLVASSPEAEHLLARRDLLVLRHRQLRAVLPVEDARLSSLLCRFLERGGAALASLSLGLQDAGGRIWQARMSLLPEDRCDIGFGARVALVVEARRSRQDLASFPLTAAERAVADALLDGLDARAIAARRGAGVETVRSQIKSVYAKTGMRGQVEFIARFGG